MASHFRTAMYTHVYHVHIYIGVSVHLYTYIHTHTTAWRLHCTSAVGWSPRVHFRIISQYDYVIKTLVVSLGIATASWTWLILQLSRLFREKNYPKKCCTNRWLFYKRWFLLRRKYHPKQTREAAEFTNSLLPGSFATELNYRACRLFEPCSGHRRAFLDAMCCSATQSCNVLPLPVSLTLHK